MVVQRTDDWNLNKKNGIYISDAVQIKSSVNTQEPVFQCLIALTAAQIRHLLAAQERPAPSILNHCMHAMDLMLYRNSPWVIHNLFSALQVFAATGNLDAEIDVRQSDAMFATTQPNTVRETFQWAITPKNPTLPDGTDPRWGGVLDTLDLIRNLRSPKEFDLAIANCIEPILPILQELVAQVE